MSAARIRTFLAGFSASSIPRKDFAYTFSRSSGPGGQNVNKVNSKATIKYRKEQWTSAPWLPEDVRQVLTTKNFPFSTKRGDILISSELTRSQKLNLDNCFEKLAEAIKEAAHVPEDTSEEALEKWGKIRKASDAHRQVHKRRASEKKQGRRRDFD